MNAETWFQLSSLRSIIETTLPRLNSTSPITSLNWNISFRSRFRDLHSEQGFYGSSSRPRLKYKRAGSSTIPMRCSFKHLNNIKVSWSCLFPIAASANFFDLNMASMVEPPVFSLQCRVDVVTGKKTSIWLWDKRKPLFHFCGSCPLQSAPLNLPVKSEGTALCTTTHTLFGIKLGSNAFRFLRSYLAWACSYRHLVALQLA